MPQELPVSVVLVVAATESGEYIEELTGCLSMGDWVSSERLCKKSKKTFIRILIQVTETNKKRRAKSKETRKPKQLH